MGTPPPTASQLAGPPQGEGVLKRLRRVFRSRKALSGVMQWIIDVGIPLALFVALFWVWAALVSGGRWAHVYKAFTLIDPPDGRAVWISSVLGWLLVPAIIGGVAGHVIANWISRAKDVTTNNLFQRRSLGQRFRPPASIASLRRYNQGTPAQRNFVMQFVRLAHNNDWGIAQDHWEIWVSDLMCTTQFGDLYREECLKECQSTAIGALVLSGMAAVCPVCAARAMNP